LAVVVMLKKTAPQRNRQCKLWAANRPVWSNTILINLAHQLWCTKPKKIVSLSVFFTFNVGYWPQCWEITWTIKTVSKLCLKILNHYIQFLKYIYLQYACEWQWKLKTY
jgi:hypothetical protein